MSGQKPIPYPFPSPPSLYHPAPQLAELLADQPVAPIVFPDGKTAWIVTRYADVRQVLVDPRFSRAAARGPDVPNNMLGGLATESIIGLDPPEHTRLRRLVARAFTQRRVEDLRPRVATLVNELIDRMEKEPKPIDLVSHFSLPLPVQVICELLGVPSTDQDKFHAWSDAIMGDLRRDPAVMEHGANQLAHYFAGLIEAKRAEPADDLLTALIAARDEDDKLSERELVVLGFGLLLAGHETTANQINMFLLTLLRYPEEWAKILADPGSIPRAVEELSRFVQLGENGAGLPRVTTEDVELSGVTIPKGSAVLPAMGIANRDPAEYAQPDRLDLARDLSQHLGFGAGVHHCLGAQLARMELQEALGGIVRRMPGIRIAVPESELKFKQTMVIRSLEALPVTW